MTAERAVAAVRALVDDFRLHNRQSPPTRTDLDALDAVVLEVRRLRAVPSLANPVRLTQELLDEHGGTLPPGSVLRWGAWFQQVADNGAVGDDPYNNPQPVQSLLTKHPGCWSVVHIWTEA